MRGGKTNFYLDTVKRILKNTKTLAWSSAHIPPQCKGGLVM